MSLWHCNYNDRDHTRLMSILAISVLLMSVISICYMVAVKIRYILRIHRYNELLLLNLRCLFFMSVIVYFHFLPVYIFMWSYILLYKCIIHREWYYIIIRYFNYIYIEYYRSLFIIKYVRYILYIFYFIYLYYIYIYIYLFIYLFIYFLLNSRGVLNT